MRMVLEEFGAEVKLKLAACGRGRVNEVRLVVLVLFMTTKLGLFEREDALRRALLK